ncbi:MAG: transposase [Limnospira sp. PMC 1286.21]|nr:MULTISPECIES: transposase [unclassified Limnospira]MDT9227493.1 transposase [Limnospira sp. PMC 1242.20]MDT9273972.1 transposase [Limnospira sp. PMC 737.11]MDT9324508.1 transposase [Limnospira sp. PMC 1286.21]
MKGKDFQDFIEQDLVPRLNPGDVVVMDNLNIHKMEGIEEMITATGARVEYLPPYSPDFNPIEMLWSTVKSVVRMFPTRAMEALEQLIKLALMLIEIRLRTGLLNAVTVLIKYRTSCKTSWADLVLRLGWLNRVGRDGRGDSSIFAFYHATFQEYFAALTVEDWDYFMPRNHVNFPVAGMRYRIFEQQWKQVILCWLGRKDIKAQKKEEFIRALVEFKGGVRDFYGDQAYLLAAAGINQFKACSLATEMVRQVVKWGFGYFNTEKQEWRTFLDPIKEAAREVIPQTIRPLAIAVLLEIIRTTENENSRRWAADSLGKIDPGNPKAIAGLLEIIRTTEDKFTRIQAADSLGKILTTPEQYAGVVSALKDCLSDETYRDNFKRFAKCYEVIWDCAENLPYPEFYQAWHNLAATPTPFIQQCNLALVPQILNQAIQTHPLNCQAICIDGSRFSDPSNPALQIYTTLKKAGCPPSPDGKPRTIAELQAYCEDDLSDHPIALILYEEPTDPPPQGFDIAVLNKLARFSHPPMAVIVPQRLPECRLPQFLESDPDLIAHLLQWLQNLAR